MRKDFIYNKINLKKRIISMATAIALISCDIPMSMISAITGKDTSLFTMTASAEEISFFPVSEYTKTYLSTDYIHIESWSDFIWYSQSYYNYSHGRYTTSIEHENDVLFMNIKDAAGNNFPLAGTGYVPIGNDTKPFEGRLVFTNTCPDTFNVPESLFGTISEKTSILDNSETSVKPIKITRVGEGSGDVLFARKVKSDNDNTTSVEWNITFDKYDNSSAVAYAGLIGEIEGGASSGANVVLTYTNNALANNSPIQATAVATDSTGKPVDAGAICGKIGTNATLEIKSYTGSNTAFTIISDNGNAGGLVGTMEAGSELTVTSGTNLQGTAGVYAENGYAGGIVGKNNGGTVTVNAAYNVQQFIHGGNGAGGLFGYYEPNNGIEELDISNLTVNCTVNLATAGIGYCGGLVGVLENKSTGSDLTITGASTGTTVTSVHNSSTDAFGTVTGAAGAAYGGLIGSYKADATSYSLLVKDITSVPTNTLSANLYGGGIGKINSGSYVKFDTFNLNSASGTSKDEGKTFGGLCADAEGAYVYAKDVTIGSSAISTFNGGGLIGKLGDGVLGMTGTTNVSNVSPSTEVDTNGQIVGTRDHALVYAENTKKTVQVEGENTEVAVNWAFTPSSVELDNIGSWGDVLVFDGTKLKRSDVFASETNHIITLNSVTTTEIDSVADFAVASVLFQINPDSNSFLSGTQLAENTTITFTDDIDLTGTSLRGITRDNTDTRSAYKGNASMTAGKKITLDIKNVGGSSRPVYRHRYLGLFGIAEGGTYSDFSLDGVILSKNGRKKDIATYVGSLAGQAKTSITVTGCKTLATTSESLKIEMTGSSDSTVGGRLIGEAVTAMGNISVSNSTFDGKITGNSHCIVGGVIGKIAGATSNAQWIFDNITIKGTVTGVKNVGGLVSDVSGDSTATLKLQGSENGIGVVIDGLNVTGNSTDSSGGLLGYNWSKTNVEVSKVSISNTPTVTQSSSGGTAGLVYKATGHWTVTNLNLSGIMMSAATAKSVGMIVNKGIDSSNGIFLELPSGFSYTLSFAFGTNVSASVDAETFDEICAYSAEEASKIMKNGQGIVSISTYDGSNASSYKLKMGSDDSINTGVTYQAQTTQGATKNPNVRYYYNLDKIKTGNTLTAAPEKLLGWGVYTYAAGNIQSFFNNSKNFAFSASDDYNMIGYSWYPVSLSGNKPVAGTFTFYNEEFTSTESAKTASNKWLPLDTNKSSQHFMMQNGLFYDVSADLTIGNTVLKGTIGAIDNTTGTGALIYGNVSGTSKDTTVVSNTGTISLAGIRVWNLSTYSSYAPLLINKASDYVTFDIKNVSTTADYKRTTTGETPVTTTIDAATSLIGKAGTRDTATVDTPISQGITVNFSGIKLDGRNAESFSAYGDTPDRYNTTKSIFTRATLLEQLIGSNGIYNYTFDEDWGTGTPHKVTYGKEVGYTTQGQYPNQELWYKDEKATGGKSRYTHPDAEPADSGSRQYTDFDSFRPYVASVSTKADIDDKTGFKYQLMVNHQPSDKIAGCGTYNDPYIITSASDLVTISKFINSSSNLNGTINYDVDKDGWCDSTTVGETTTLYTEHFEYTLNGTSAATCSGQSNVTADDMRKYLASAYYQIRLSGANQLVLSSSSGFLGLGTPDIPFSGVIDGGQNSTTTIVNETQYPLINYSGGCVVRNLIVTVNATVTLDDATDSYDYITGGKSHGAYGAIIAVVEGGDNIIDNTQVTFGTSVINAKGKKAQFQPIGGYVGVVVNGGVIFRNMTTGNISGLSSSNVSAVKGGNWPQINDLEQTPALIDTVTELAERTVNMTDSDNLLWLYVNPIIGRVINGYAVNIASEYHPAYSDCVMNNGNKSYSITDISLSGGSLTISGSNLTVPNGQALFLTSVIVNSGMGATKLGYTTTYTKRTAAYDKVGSNAAAPSSCPDYDTYARNDTTSGPAFIIKNFAAEGNTLGSGGPWNITLTSNGSFVLPDGFRGIGNFYQKDTDLLLNVSSFEGNNNTITQNTIFYMYEGATSKGISNGIEAHLSEASLTFDKTYLPSGSYTLADAKDNAAGYGDGQPDGGLGLFTAQFQGGAVYQNFTLSGLVKYDIIDHKTGDSVEYTRKNVNTKNLLSVGGLFGNFSGAATNETDKTEIKNYSLTNLEVYSAKNAGGLIGYIPIDNYKKLKLDINTTKDSTGITVTAGLNAGGLIARSYSADITIDFNNKRFGLTKVESKTKENVGSGSNDYGFGVGGIIGTLRCGNPTNSSTNPAPAVTIKNVTIGDKNAKVPLEIMCSEANCGMSTGGLIGIINRASPTMINCHVYNVSVSAGGSNSYVGGAFGHVRTNSVVTIQNSSIISNITDENNRPIISGAYMSGGFLAHSNSDTFEFIIQKSSIEGYDISGTNAGGVVAYRNSNSGKNLKIEDFAIIDCSVTGSSVAGGLLGELNRNLSGYNVLAKEVTISGAGTKGFAIATNKGVAKLVGFSRQADSPSTMVQAMTGGSNATDYGSGGYVIFADYMGTASYDNSTFTPGENSKNAFSGMTSSTNVAPYAPYVSTSPFANIANYNSTMQFLLGDGISPLKSETVGKSTEAFAKIYQDIIDTNNGYYQAAKAYLDTEAEYSAYTSKISSFKTEMGSTKNLASGIDFPVLILDNINKAEMTAFINKYICLLTNTTTSSEGGGTYNFASANGNVYNVDIKRVSFNSDGTAISSIADNACLKKANNQFYIEANNTDTLAATAQFTLLDVQFKDPSASGTVAYHLYIPCYVRKLLEYDFDIHIDSGTNYDINPYTALDENNLVENIGTPITLEFAYTYNRTAEDWTIAANSGDSLLANYTKSLLFDNITAVSEGSKPNLPNTTQMVLIDTQNSSKAYYLDSLSNTSFIPDGDYRTLNFGEFTDLSGISYSPVNFNDMLNVSVATASDGSLVQDNNNATVKDTTTGFKYRMATETEKSNASIPKFTATVTFKGGATKLSEHYFLTIYTPYSTTDVVYHYAIQANKSLGNSPYPSRITPSSEGNASNLFIGYIYNNNVFIDSLKVSGESNAVEITKDRNSIEASLRAEIGLTASGEENIRPVLSGDTPPDIYQSFLIKLNKDGNEGLLAVSSVNVGNYMIGGKPVTHASLNPSWTSSDYTDIQIPSYVELRNGAPLASSLAQVSEGNTLSITAEATLTFDADKGDITTQFFPQMPEEKRTTFVAYSNIASSSSQTASSKVSARGEGIPRYYTIIEEKATLNYDALEIESEGYLPQLGVNVNDSKDSKKLPWSIKTIGSYNVENCLSAWDSANFVKIEIELKSKADDYSTSLNIFDYLDEDTFEIFDGELDDALADAGNSNAITTGTTSTKMVYIIHKDLLADYFRDKVYQIPINFKVYSGSGTANKFEDVNRQYSNYGIYLKVSMLQTASSATAVSGSEPEYTNNYVKYTNARIYLNKVNASKTYSGE